MFMISYATLGEIVKQGMVLLQSRFLPWAQLQRLMYDHQPYIPTAQVNESMLE